MTQWHEFQHPVALFSNGAGHTVLSLPALRALAEPDLRGTRHALR